MCFRGSGDRPEAKNVAIVITDGVPYPDDRRQPAIDEAEKLRMERSKFIHFVSKNESEPVCFANNMYFSPDYTYIFDRPTETMKHKLALMH